jgi:hypothetical protein
MLQTIISKIKNQDVLGDWVFTDPQVIRWFNAADDRCRLIWLQGIPGAGTKHFDVLISGTSVLMSIDEQSGIV